ncbi:MAG: hypothetical protein IKH15_12475 [Bacteroidales bacterium]|nr:hypothetical protein [Bacteroidales bacterium]
MLWHNYWARKTKLLPLYAQREKAQPCRRQDDQKKVVFVVTADTTFNMGLADRLRGVTSVYKVCKELEVPFKLYFKVPNLVDYLIPNGYDWVMDDLDFCYDAQEAYPCTLLTFHANLKDRLQSFVHQRILKHYIRKPYRQIHVHTNMVASEKEYGTLFKELFKPTPLLQEQLDIHLSELGGEQKYFAMVYRFRQLLGDLKDGGECLPENKREEYISQAVECVKKEHEKRTDEKILVTSDSKTFISRIKQLPYVYTLPGEVVHMGVTTDADKTTYLKSFLDYYMLSFAHTVISVRDKKMYHSGFALRAAMLNGSSYREVWM